MRVHAAEAHRTDGRTERTITEPRLRLAQAVESQFDTGVVAAFEAILAGSDEEYRTATREDFKPGSPSAFEDQAQSSPSSSLEAALGAA